MRTRKELKSRPKSVINGMVIASAQEHASIRCDGICPSLTSAMGSGGGQTPMIVEKDEERNEGNQAWRDIRQRGQHASSGKRI